MKVSEIKALARKPVWDFHGRRSFERKALAHARLRAAVRRAKEAQRRKSN